MKTAEVIFEMIDNHMIPRDSAIAYIENYALSREIQAVQKFHQEMHGGCPEAIEAVINRIEAQLEELLDKTVEACTVKL